MFNDTDMTDLLRLLLAMICPHSVENACVVLRAALRNPSGSFNCA